MKKGKLRLWILGIIAWFFLLTFFAMEDEVQGTSSHQLILIITGVCLAIYLWKNSGRQSLEKENQELRAEVQRLREELEAQKAVARAIEKSEERN